MGLVALSLYCEHTVYPRVNKVEHFLKNLNDSIIECIAFANKLHALSATAVQKWTFSVYLNRALEICIQMTSSHNVTIK